MSSRAPASLRARGLFNPLSVTKADDGEEKVEAAAAASTSTSAVTTSPEGDVDDPKSSSSPHSSSYSPPSPPRPNASSRDAALIRLHAAACQRSWAELPDLARDALAAGCGQPELRATLRHLVICAGYAGSLAATSALSKAKLLGPATPGKVEGPPSDAFGLMYGREGSELVARRLHRLDPVLAKRLRKNVYGDLYGDAGLPLSTRQLLMVSFLGEAGMQDELFGHAQAALLAGCSPRELVAAAEAGFRAAARAVLAETESTAIGARRRASYSATMATLEAAWARHRERFPGAAAAVKDREKRKESGGESVGSEQASSSPTSSAAASLLPNVLVAGRDITWWNCVPDLDLEDFSLGSERVPRGNGK